MYKQFIDVSQDTHAKLERIFQVSKITVWRALQFISGNAERAARIRKAALENGGTLMCTTPECETLHDSDGHIYQIFPNGAMLDIDKTTGTAILTMRDGTIASRQEQCTIRDLVRLQNYANIL